MLNYKPDDDVAARRTIDDRIKIKATNLAWVELTDRSYVQQTLRILLQMKIELEGDFSRKLAERKNQKIGQVEYLEWKSKAQYYYSILEDRIRYTKQKMDSYGISPRKDIRHIGDLYRAIESLVQAITDHKQDVEAEYEPTTEDRKLWLRLQTIRVPENDGVKVVSVTAEEFLRKRYPHQKKS